MSETVSQSDILALEAAMVKDVEWLLKRYNQRIGCVVEPQSMSKAFAVMVSVHSACDGECMCMELCAVWGEKSVP